MEEMDKQVMDLGVFEHMDGFGFGEQQPPEVRITPCVFNTSNRGKKHINQALQKAPTQQNDVQLVLHKTKKNIINYQAYTKRMCRFLH